MLISLSAVNVIHVMHPNLFLFEALLTFTQNLAPNHYCQPKQEILLEYKLLKNQIIMNK